MGTPVICMHSGRGELTVSDSAMTVPATTTAFCDRCGRVKREVDQTPVFQSVAELPPLDQHEYETLLQQERVTTHRMDGSLRSELQAGAGIADYFLDHKMGQYLRAVDSFGSTEATLSIPGRR